MAEQREAFIAKEEGENTEISLQYIQRIDIFYSGALYRE